MAKTEISAMGEDTDGMAESTSKLREQIAALTNVDGTGGFDIMTADGTAFKSTYEILQGIAKVWKDMNDVDSAALLELVAGKNRAQGAAALLDQWSRAEEALATANDSEGSALEENERWMSSIEARIQVLQASFQNLWSNAISSEFIGFIVDAGTAILKLVDNVGMLRTAIASIAAIASFKGAGRANLNSRPHLKMPAINCLIA